MYNGIINVYKEAGFTSHDVVAKLRGILKQKKIGHTGTLDPDAVGVLPVCLGSGTKLCDFLTDKKKEYRAELRLGVKTDTQDMSGQVLETREVKVTEEQIRSVAASFVGDYDQIPPMYSALKVDGKKLYELAREGKEIERKARRIQIYEIEIEEIALPVVKMRVLCGKGTYIRTLCQDIGEKLGCLGAMQSLIRSGSGDFKIEDALTLTQIEQCRDEGCLDKKIVPVDAVFKHLPAYAVKKEYRKLIDNGNALLSSHIVNLGEEELFLNSTECRIYNDEQRFCGIYRKENEIWKPVKMFMER